jgi:hypothetical protein
MLGSQNEWPLWQVLLPADAVTQTQKPSHKAHQTPTKQGAHKKCTALGQYQDHQY